MNSDKQKIIVVLLLVSAYLCYSFNIYFSLPIENYTVSSEALRGKVIWQKYNCNACHQIYGLGGFLGPDITNVSSLRNESYIKIFLQNGTDRMPNFHLTDQEIQELVAYLNSIDKTGNSDPRTFILKYNGTIEQ